MAIVYMDINRKPCPEGEAVMAMDEGKDFREEVYWLDSFGVPTTKDKATMVRALKFDSKGERTEFCACIAPKEL